MEFLTYKGGRTKDLYSHTPLLRGGKGMLEWGREKKTVTCRKVFKRGTRGDWFVPYLDYSTWSYPIDVSTQMRLLLTPVT